MSLPILQLRHDSGHITTVRYGYQPGHDDLDVIRNADHQALSEHSRKQRTWLLSLADEHQDYWTHLVELDNLWPWHSEGLPALVSAPGHPLLEQLVADHFTQRGHACNVAAPGAMFRPEAGFSNAGKDMASRAIWGNPSFTGASGTSTGSSASSLTDTGASFPASSGGPPQQGGLVGHIVQCGSVYGVIIANTSTVLTVDMWHSATAPGTVGSTPGATSAYTIHPGQAPAWFVGISTATRAFNAADPFLTNDGSTISELWFSGGGLQRKLSTVAHTTGTNTSTLTATWTANGSDTLPQVVAKWACFQAQVTAAPTTSTSGPGMVFDTVLSSTATLAASGDNVTITDTLTS